MVKLKIEDIERRKEQLRKELAFLPEKERDLIIEDRIKLEIERRPGKFKPLDLKNLPEDFASRCEDYL